MCSIRAGLFPQPLRAPELAKYVVVIGADAYRVLFALADFAEDFSDRVLLLADKKDGSPLPANATPYQLIAPGDKRPARWVRQVVELQVSPSAQ
jgi:hypothetical protein